MTTDNAEQSSIELRQNLNSHISAINGMLSLLCETGLSEDQSAYIDTIKNSLQQLQGEIDKFKTEAELLDHALTRKNLHILHVDDDALQRVFVQRVLEKAGYKITVIDGGKKALALLAQQQFDLILMDCEMPGMDGFDTTTAIRQTETPLGKHTPIIAFTAYKLAGYKQRCLQIGMDEYISKPLPASELLSKLDEMIKKFVLQK